MRKVTTSAVPQEMKDRRQWVVWRREERDGKPTKVPYNALTGERASSTDPSTWSTFDEAVSSSDFDGVGFVFSADDPFFGVDLDNCIDDVGNLHPEAAWIPTSLDTYCEWSPSGSGLHIIGRGCLPGTRNRTNKTAWGGVFEVYDKGRYFTITGEPYGEPRAIADRQGELSSLVEVMFPAPVPSPIPRVPVEAVDLSDKELLDKAMRAKNGDRFERLWNGDTSGFGSHSEADLALCGALAFWTGGDIARMDRMFRSSGLYRDKWDRDSYGRRTLERAVEGRVDFYRDPTITRTAISNPGNSPTEPTEHPLEGGYVTSVGSVGGFWEKPLPLSQLPDLAPFPISSLPDFTQPFVAGIAEHTQTPTDLAGCLTLSVLGTLFGGRVRVAIEPGWDEPLNIWTVVLLYSGERKSPVFRTITKPLYELESELYEEVRPAIVEAQAQRKIAEIARDQAQATAGKTEDAVAREEKTADAVHAAARVEEIVVPPRPRLQTDDVTAEAIAGLLAASPHGAIGVHSDEADIFDLMAGRYSDGKANLGVFLKGHSGTPFTRDRRSGEMEYIARPAITMGLAVQPAIIKQLAARPEMREKGIVPRFLWSWPETNLGDRRSRRTTVPTEVIERYERTVKRLGRARYNARAVDVVEMSPEAREQIYRLMDVIEVQLGEGGRLEFMRDWANKLVGATARIAGLIHFGEEREGEISVGTVDRAITLAHYFLNHTMKVFTEADLDPLVRKAHAIVRWIERNKRDSFSQREIHQQLNGTFKRAADLDGPLRLLVEHDYIRPVQTPAAPTGRKPSQRYEVNPELLGAPTEPTERSEEVSL